jgi:hypothetical protein
MVQAISEVVPWLTTKHQDGKPPWDISSDDECLIYALIPESTTGDEIQRPQFLMVRTARCLERTVIAEKAY